MQKKRVVIFLGLALLGLSVFIIDKNFVERINSSTVKSNLEAVTKEDKKLEIVATNLDVPWALAFLPFDSAQGKPDLLITERKGTIKLLKNGQIKEIAKIDEVKQIGEGGLHGIAVDPNFTSNNYIYLYLTYGETLGNTQNKVVRYKLISNSLSEKTTLVDNIPGASIHDGGRLKFGPDRNLYITTGDAANPSLSQNPKSLAGKILRILPNGQVEIFSLGHRNPQGIAWDKKENLWEVEHGSSAFDEINFIEKGQNYGWPEIRGYDEKEDMEKPILHSDSDTWAPAGIAYFEDFLYFGGLRGQALYQYNIATKELKIHFKGQFGRIRDVVLGPDNFLYITTSNRDGRGTPSARDDKILRLDPETF